MLTVGGTEGGHRARAAGELLVGVSLPLILLGGYTLVATLVAIASGGFGAVAAVLSLPLVLLLLLVPVLFAISGVLLRRGEAVPFGAAMAAVLAVVAVAVVINSHAFEPRLSFETNRCGGESCFVWVETGRPVLINEAAVLAFVVAGLALGALRLALLELRDAGRHTAFVALSTVAVVALTATAAWSVGNRLRAQRQATMACAEVLAYRQGSLKPATSDEAPPPPRLVERCRDPAAVAEALRRAKDEDRRPRRPSPVTAVPPTTSPPSRASPVVERPRQREQRAPRPSPPAVAPTSARTEPPAPPAFVYHSGPVRPEDLDQVVPRETTTTTR